MPSPKMSPITSVLNELLELVENSEAEPFNRLSKDDCILLTREIWELKRKYATPPAAFFLSPQSKER